MQEPETTVIIPTLGTARRAALLARAIKSVLDQHPTPGVPLVVLNGELFDHDVRQWLERRSDVRFAYEPRSSVSSARLAGLRRSATPYFCFLDDDDELLPNCLKTRVDAFCRQGPADLVVTNGFIQNAGLREIAVPEFDKWPQDHALAILHSVWLNSASASYNAATIGENDFSCLPDILEWTYFGFRLALEKRRILRINVHTYVIHRESPDHVTLTDHYSHSAPLVIKDMMKLPMAKSLMRILIGKYSAALHQLADTHLARRNFGSAWKYHLLSMCSSHGLRYAPFTRHLVAQQFFKVLSGYGIKK